ncbi:MAG: tRNA pseudouridine38-40 synthase [Gammaproteobacteria bacterium]|jgi:tRNA pseudouridine38-40 synthase
MRIALGVEYDGRDFHGWQRQRHVRSVQACIEQGLSKVANQPVSTVCAGRTDARVHALAQVVHFDTQAQRNEHSWVLGANSNLPDDASILWAREVDDSFHARFSATGRSYRYVILNRLARPAALRGRVTWQPLRLDEVEMASAAQLLLGKHDFSAFRASGCQANSPVRTLRELNVTRHGEYVVLQTSANGFLQHMVRNIAGVLMAIGLHKQPAQWATQVLQSRDRRCGGVTASPHGLYLTAVQYPERFDFPVLSPSIGLW